MTVGPMAILTMSFSDLKMYMRRVEVKLKRLKTNYADFQSTKNTRKSSRTRQKVNTGSKQSSKEPEIEYPCDQCEFVSSKLEHLVTHRVGFGILLYSQNMKNF